MPARHLRALWTASLAAGLAATISLAAGGLSSALAQVVPGGLPATINPSVIQQNVERDFQKGDESVQPLNQPQAPELHDETESAAPESAPAADEESPTFVLKEIAIQGVTVLDHKLLEEKFSPWIDREVGFQDLVKITAEVTKLYKEQGYITSKAVLPLQDIENGIVNIQVIEGKVGEIRVEGNKHVRDRYIAARIHQQPGEVFRLQTLQKDMLNLSGDTLFDKVHATLKTGAKEGTSDLVIDIDDHNPLHFMVGVDNMGRNGIGLWRTNYTLSHENLLGFGDSLALNAVLASRTVAAAGQYRFPLTQDGVYLGASYSYTHINAGETPLAIPIGNTIDRRTVTGDSHRYAAFLDFPIYRTPVTRQWDITGNVALNFIDSMTYLDGHSLQAVQQELRSRFGVVSTEEFPSIRSLTSRVQTVKQDTKGRWLLAGTMTNAASILGGNESFIKFNTELSRLQALPWGMIGVFRAEGQFTPNRLPFAEKMQVGGGNSVRGYSEGLLIADSGYLLSAEVRYPLKFLPKKIENDWQGLVFAEHGRVYVSGDRDDPVAFGLPGSLFGYGVGVRGRVTKYANVRLDLGLNTTRDENQPDLRAHFSLQSPLF